MSNASPLEVVTIPYFLKMEECAPVQKLPHVYYEPVDVHLFTNYTFILHSQNHHIIPATIRGIPMCQKIIEVPIDQKIDPINVT